MGRPGTVAVVLVALLAAGCSWITVDAPPATAPAQGAASCTESRIAPAVDTLIATLTAIGALYFVASDDEHHLVGAAVEGVMSTTFAISAWSGYRDTGRCRALRRGAR